MDRLDVIIANLQSRFGDGEAGRLAYNFQIYGIFILVAIAIVCLVNVTLSRSWSRQTNARVSNNLATPSLLQQ